MPIVLVALLIVALLAFLFAAFQPEPPRVASIKLIAFGLFLITLVWLIQLGGR